MLMRVLEQKNWTESSLEESVEEEGDQTGEQYSRIRRTNE